MVAVREGKCDGGATSDGVIMPLMNGVSPEIGADVRGGKSAGVEMGSGGAFEGGEADGLGEKRVWKEFFMPSRSSEVGNCGVGFGAAACCGTECCDSTCC